MRSKLSTVNNKAILLVKYWPITHRYRKIRCVAGQAASQSAHTKVVLTRRLLASINILAITDFDYVDDQHCVLDRVENAIAALTNSIPFAARQLQRTRRPGVVS